MTSEAKYFIAFILTRERGASFTPLSIGCRAISGRSVYVVIPNVGDHFIRMLRANLSVFTFREVQRYFVGGVVL